MSEDLMIYLKTTDTCQLNCNHCFTNGSNGQKGFFDVDATISFLKRLHEFKPNVRNGNISFHGGEPMLCPPDKMKQVWNECKHLWPSLFWSVQTNLTYKLDAAKVDIFETVCQKHWGTSWDYNIRWSNTKMKELWEDNVRQLSKDGHMITAMVSLSGNLVKEKEPMEIIDELMELGIKYVNFERVTPNGNALDFINKGIMPSNLELDAWLNRMWEQTLENKTWEKIDNMFFGSLLTSIVHNSYSGCRCRQCEQKILTINANGTIGGCPNSAVENVFGNIHQDVPTLMSSEGRVCNINKEATLNSNCFSCDVYDICNGDCHQLAWEGDLCAAPKTMMRNMKERNDIELYKEILGDFQGQE